MFLSVHTFVADVCGQQSQLRNKGCMKVGVVVKYLLFSGSYLQGKERDSNCHCVDIFICFPFTGIPCTYTKG